MKLQSNATFWVASCAFVLVFMTSGTPISLFNLYRAENGLTNADLGVVSLAYFISAAVALLMFGRLSNHVGRKPMALIAIGCCALSCVCLMLMSDVTLLFAARLLQGFACGVATSSIGAYAVDAGEHQPKWLVAAVASTSPMVGIPLGAISSGALVTWGPYPKITIFALVLTLLLVCLALLFNCRETINRQPRGTEVFAAKPAPAHRQNVRFCRHCRGSDFYLVGRWLLSGLWAVDSGRATGYG